MALLLRLVNIEKSYKITKTQKQDVLKGLSVEFDSGELVALVGESGCGKSTLMNILGGLDMDYTGSIVCKGEFLRDFSEKEMDDYRKKTVGLVFQNYNLIRHMTIRENVEIAMSITNINKADKEQRALDLLKLVGLEGYKDKLPNQLSGGQKQRVAIARALANNPYIILADEPTGALDKESAEVVMQILKKIAESGKLVIVVTHSSLVSNQCGRIIHLDDGVIVSDEFKYKSKIEDKRIKKIEPKSIKTKELWDLSYRNLKQTKSRSVLVSIGMAIGILAVILILCLSEGISSYIDDVYSDSLSSTQITVTRSTNNRFSTDQISSIESITGIKSYHVSTNYQNASYVYEDETKLIKNLSMFYSDYSVDILYGSLPTSKGYVVINSSLANDISNNNILGAIGKEISLTVNGKSSSVLISGIYDDISDKSSQSNCLLTEYDESTFSLSSDNIIYITLKSVSYANSVIDDLEELGFNVYIASDTVQTIVSYINMGTNVLIAVAAISMVVAAIMIFIVLYISIVERTKEIGILRAIGSRKSDIKKLFIFESGMLGLLGGVIGTVGCLAVTIITNIICQFTLKQALISYNFWYYLLGIALSTGISLLAGIAPAMKASELDPVEALRYE